MKNAVLLVAGAATVAYAKPHGHAHKHHRREPDAVTVVQPVSTAFAYVLNGESISQEDVCSGILSGHLKWDGEPPAGVCSAVTSVAVSTPTTSQAATSTPQTTAAAAQFYEASSSSAAASTAAASSSSSSSSINLSSITKYVASLAEDEYPDFEDGVHACSDGVPTQYGAIPVSHLNLDGWLGIQVLNSDYNEILSDGSSCTDGSSCSYSCAPGYQKTQWVTDQPSSGASIGGLLCKGGKLYKANSNAKICGRGSGGVTVHNQASDAIAICRTDYPGSESETVPVDVSAGDTQPLTCPDENTYYQHLGSATSAQYYLNPIGVTATQGCSWNGLGDKQTGNWAPVNLGVGSVDGVKWLSIFQNAPTSSVVFQGTVNITGDGISASCSYEPTSDGTDGKYCGAAGCQYISSGGNVGCTVSVTGDAIFVVSN